MGGKEEVRRDFPMGFSVHFSLQTPQKLMFTEREEYDTNPRRILFKISQTQASREL